MCDRAHCCGGVPVFEECGQDRICVLPGIFGGSSPAGGLRHRYVLNILLKRIERFWFPGTKRKFLIKLRRPVCILLSFLALVLIMAGVVYLVVPELVSSIRW